MHDVQLSRKMCLHRSMFFCVLHDKFAQNKLIKISFMNCIVTSKVKAKATRQYFVGTFIATIIVLLLRTHIFEELQCYSARSTYKI